MGIEGIKIGAGVSFRSKSGMPIYRAKDGKHSFTFMFPRFDINPLYTPKRAAQKRMDIGSEGLWQREMMGNPRAMQGSLVFPEFNRAVHVIPANQVPREMTCYCAIDPHPRTPHGVLWLGVDRFGDFYVYRELWPSIAYGILRKVRDDEAENQYPIWQYADTIARLEGNEIEWRYTKGTVLGEKKNRDSGRYRKRPMGEEIVARYMDQAGKAFRASGEGERVETYNERYRKFGIYCIDPYKRHEAGFDAIRDALKLRPYNNGFKPRLMIAGDCPELLVEFENFRFMQSSDKLDKDQNQKTIEFRTHLIDCLRYILTTGGGPRYNQHRLSDPWLARAA